MTFRTVTGTDFGRAIRSARSKPASGLKQAIFGQLCVEAGLAMPVHEYRFHEVRRWKFDYAWPAAKVALEVEGGVWTGGRHTRGSGFVKDIEKYNAAASLGWRVFKCVPADLCRPETVDMIAGAVDERGTGKRP